MSGCWCVSLTCLGSVLPVLLVVFLFLPLVVLVSYHYLLRFDVLGCSLLASRCLLWYPMFPVHSVSSSLLAVSWIWCARSVFLVPRSPLYLCSVFSPGCVFFLLALSFFSLFLSWSSLSPLAVALLLVSGFSSQSLLVYLSLVSLLVYLVWPFFTLGGSGLSRRRSRSLLLLSLSRLTV